MASSTSPGVDNVGALMDGSCGWFVALMEVDDAILKDNVIKVIK